MDKSSRVHIESTRSLRPKDFTRNTYQEALRESDSQRYLKSLRATLKNGTVNEILQHALVDKYERKTYKTDAWIQDQEEIDRLYEENKVHQRRDNFLETHRHLRETNKKKIEELNQRHHQTQMVKRDREIRDLQFELMKTKIEELKVVHARQVHQKEGENGFVEFERNMKKIGIGGNDGGDSRMSVSYESADAYEKRIKELANEKLPTNEEVNNFTTQLRQRTLEKKQARYEKARRRRRALVDQGTPGDTNIS